MSPLFGNLSTCTSRQTDKALVQSVDKGKGMHLMPTGKQMHTWFIHYNHYNLMTRLYNQGLSTAGLNPRYINRLKTESAAAADAQDRCTA